MAAAVLLVGSRRPFPSPEKPDFVIMVVSEEHMDAVVFSRAGLVQQCLAAGREVPKGEMKQVHICTQSHNRQRLKRARHSMLAGRLQGCHTEQAHAQLRSGLGSR